MAGFAQLLDKIGRGETLSARELAELRDETRAIEEVKNLAKGWVIPGTGIPIFKSAMQTIYSSVLNVNTASVVVPISGEYKHLLFMGSGRTNGAGALFVYLFGRYNGDSGTNYRQQKFLANFTTLTGEGNTSQTGALLGALTEGGSPALEGGSWITFIPHYKSSFYKVSLSLMWPGYNATVEYFVSSVWASTDPIRQITLLPVSDSIAAGAVLSLYGIV